MKALPIATGRLQLLRLFSTLLSTALVDAVFGEEKARACVIAGGC